MESDGDSWDPLELMSVDEARAAGMPEDVINAALLEADRLVYGKRIDRPSVVTPLDGD